MVFHKRSIIKRVLKKNNKYKLKKRNNLQRNHLKVQKNYKLNEKENKQLKLKLKRKIKSIKNLYPSFRKNCLNKFKFYKKYSIKQKIAVLKKIIIILKKEINTEKRGNNILFKKKEITYYSRNMLQSIVTYYNNNKFKIYSRRKRRKFLIKTVKKKNFVNFEKPKFSVQKKVNVTNLKKRFKNQVIKKKKYLNIYKALQYFPTIIITIYII